VCCLKLGQDITYTKPIFRYEQPDGMIKEIRTNADCEGLGYTACSD